ncbi:MAG: 5-guanidino-2-oxopentanoate decarboxylase [Rhodobacteraceae bacterium]|nr:5-guanidino-2-oxopentanoate decarboxylase [Paracoccaceae bacterium]
MTDTRPLGAQISHMLKARGVDVIFGIPGVHNVELYRGIEEAGITHVLARHEQGAGFMADGYARATGRPGVCYTITGPGILNALTALGQAQSDSVPVLSISSCLNAADLGMGRARLHEMADQAGAAGTVCGWSRTALDAAAAYALIDRALAEFACARPGARAIHVPIDVLTARAPGHPPAPALPRRPAPDPSALAEAAALIGRARRPLFVFGGGARGAAAAARAVLDRSGGAAFTTYAGRGIVAPDHPRLFGSTLELPDSARIFAAADLVVAVGTELAETDIWRDHLGHACPLVRVDIDPRELADDTRADLAILGDAGAVLAGLAQGLEPRDGLWTEAELREARQRWRATVDADRPGVLPAVEALWAALPPGTTVYSDMTQFAYVANMVCTPASPGLWHHPCGFGTLGYALPAAIGGKVGLPDRPVLAVLGDYGFQYTLQELGTAVELGLPLPVVIWDNGKLKEIEDSMRRNQIAPNAVVARNPDFLALARAYGAGAEEPQGPAGLAAALERAFAAGGPTLIRLTPEAMGRGTGPSSSS